MSNMASGSNIYSKDYKPSGLKDYDSELSEIAIAKLSLIMAMTEKYKDVYTGIIRIQARAAEHSWTEVDRVRGKQNDKKITAEESQQLVHEKKDLQEVAEEQTACASLLYEKWKKRMNIVEEKQEAKKEEMK